MALSSSIKGHRQEQRIIDALAAGTPYRDIASWTDPPVTPMALSRYKRSAVDALLRRVTEANAAVANNDTNLTTVNSNAVTQVALAQASDPFLLAAQKQTDRRGRWIREIENAGDYTDSGPDYATLAKLDRNDQTGLELHARLAGRLDAPGANQTNIMIVCPATQQAPSVTLEPDAVVIDIGTKA